MKSIRQAFTMIELTFVIVIIGILASVALPKLSANRTDASSSICVNQVGQFFQNVSSYYMAHGYDIFKNLKSSEMTNMAVATSSSSGFNGFLDETIDTVGVDYYCDGDKVATFKGFVASTDYNLSISLENESSVSSPIAQKTIKKIKEHLLNGNYSKVYSL